MPSEQPSLAIVNPKAGGGVHDVFRRREHELLDRLGAMEVAFTEGPGHATRLAAEALDAGVRRIVVAGGDGTVNEVVNGWLHPDGRPRNPEACLALLAGGTGGDLRRTLGIGSADEAIAAMTSGHTRVVDVGRLTYQAAEEPDPQTRYFVNIASFGLGGLVDRHVHAYSSVAGRYAYALATARALLTWKNPTVRLVLEGPDTRVDMELRSAMVAVANGRYFGGGMHVAPGAEMDDGLFHVTIVGDVRRRDILALSPRLYEGTHVRHPEVTVRAARTVVAESDDLVWLDVDGEPLGRLPARFEVVPGALRLAVP